MSGFLTTNPKKIHSVPYFRIAKNVWILKQQHATCYSIKCQHLDTRFPQKHCACIIVGLKKIYHKHKKEKTKQNKLNHAISPLGSS